MPETPFQFNIINTTADTQVGQTLTWMSQVLRAAFTAPFQIINACQREVLGPETSMQFEDVSQLPPVQLRSGKNPIDLFSFTVGKIFIPVDLQPAVGYIDYGGTLIAQSVKKQNQFRTNCIESLLRYMYQTITWVVLNATKTHTATGTSGKLCYSDFLKVRKMFADQFALGTNYAFISPQAVLDVNTELLTSNIKISEVKADSLLIDAPVGRISNFNTFEWPFIKQVENETDITEHNIFMRQGAIALGMKDVTDMSQETPGVAIATYRESGAGISFTISAEAKHNPIRVEYVIEAKFGAGILDDRVIVDVTSKAPLPEA